MRYLDAQQREQIGFSYILDSLRIITNIGMQFKRELMPFGIKKTERLKRELDDIGEVIEKILKQSEIEYDIGEALCKIKDISGSVRRLLHGNAMDDVELYEIKYFAKISDDVRRAYLESGVQAEGIELHCLEEVFDLLDPEEKKLTTFHIYDIYSDKLREIREAKRELEKKIGGLLGQEESRSLLDERLQYVVAEEEEERRIRIELSDKLRSYGEKILQNLTCIGRLDFLIAKSRYLMEQGAVRPTITDGERLYLKNASNPMVKDILQKNKKRFTEISIEMAQGATIITGANMGGKSVTINTITLNVLLAQMGFYVFCEEAEIPVYDFVYFISDDMQSVERGLSTFGAEIIQLRTVVGASRVAKGFIALDELARGTNPKEGRDIVQAIIYFLRDKKVNALISTHYDGIDVKGSKHYQVVGLKHLDFEKLKYQIDLNKKASVDIIQQNMDYHLEEAGENEIPKDALNIALLLGLDSEILNIIKNFYKE